MIPTLEELLRIKAFLAYDRTLRGTSLILPSCRACLSRRV